MRRSLRCVSLLPALYCALILAACSDKQGTFVIKPQFDRTRNFSEGLAAVKVADKWGFIDKQGAVVSKPQFGVAKEFSEDLAAVYVAGKWGFIKK